ncbi:unnamed protein product [Rotaria magnacalcarata]|uniref:Protein fem-1 homolog B n=3 Tax=Rotaria magnacalcarata TaxID=392030 RepID=A0A816SPH2_9BILA|nr:unnamed protein product [Rotaria magnacalcarata]
MFTRNVISIIAIYDEELIHNAVCHGYVISLEIYLQQKPKSACFYQYEHIVRMLFTRFKSEIEALGTNTLTSIDNRLDLVEEVSALWAAAAVNNLDIVKLLIERGNANINHLIKTHSTALRAAYFQNNLEMVRYLVEHGANPHQSKKGNYTNLMLSACRQYPSMVDYLVNKVKCDINAQDENGQTALYHAVRSGSVEITKFLLEHVAMNIRDNKRKVTPLMRAALFGEISLVDTFKYYCTDLEWTEAKELLAASFSGCVSQSFVLLQDRRECETPEQLNQLICPNKKDALRIESLLIHQRIIDHDHSDYHDVIHHYGARLANEHKYHECFRCWFYEFDLKIKYNMIFQSDFLNHFIFLFAKMKFNNKLTIPIEDLLQMFKITNHVLMSDYYRENFDANLIILLHLITIVGRIIHSEYLDEKQELSLNNYRDFYNSIASITSHQYRTIETGSSLLHLCTNASTESISFLNDYPCWITTRLLIGCGANVNVFDSDGNTPSHNLVKNIPMTNVLKKINLLYNADAHLDYINNKGQTPLQSMPLLHIKIIEHLKKNMDVIRLKCCCAKLIRQQKFSYENIFSTALVGFIR